MLIGISNIAWPALEDSAILPELRGWGAECLEVAPPRTWGPEDVLRSDVIRTIRGTVESFGLRVVALQSLLFQRPELTLFGTAEARAKTANRLRMLCDAASEIGATVLVFGSPKNRQRGLLSLEAADEIAVPFFGALGDHAHSRGVSLCIEPLPTSLGCDYIHTAEDGARLARKVGSQGFALHLDASALHANRETPEHAVAGSIDVLRHFHISETGYVEPGASGVDHSGMAAALRAHGYAGAVSIEMTSVPTADSGPRVRAALDYARSVYV